MRVLVTGGSGQLGYALHKTKPPNIELIAPGREVLDLQLVTSIEHILGKIKPDAIVNAAAYTAVDKAEGDPETAELINARAVEQMARYASVAKIPMIHISTDFIFDGGQGRPYCTDDKPLPLGVYGKTKLLGEQLLLRVCPEAKVVRTGWVYCEHGSNFVKTMLHLAGGRDELSVVDDQIGTPTYAVNLADALWKLLAAMPSSRIFHFSDAGVASWYDFAVAIFEEAMAAGLLEKKPVVNTIPAESYDMPAPRPKYSVLDKSSICENVQLERQHWREALRVMLAALREE